MDPKLYFSASEGKSSGTVDDYVRPLLLRLVSSSNIVFG